VNLRHMTAIVFCFSALLGCRTRFENRLNSNSYSKSSGGKPRVAVIGSGPAGTRVLSLLEREFGPDKIELHLFEAQDFIGGRTASRNVTLSNGVTTTVNTGTQMNFQVFVEEIAPELKAIDNLFNKPNQAILLAGAGKLHYIPRGNPSDPDEAYRIGQSMARSGLLSNEDLAFSGLALTKLDQQELRSLPFDNLVAYYHRNPSWDGMSASDFLFKNWRPALTDKTGFMGFMKAAQLYAEYTRLPRSLAKADKAADILENALFWGLSPDNRVFGVPFPFTPGRTTKVFFTRPYVHRMIESMESLVEFTDLNSMSALNFLWQLKWTTHGGDMLVARNWNKVPEFYLSQAPSTQVHLNHKVTSIKKNENGRFEISYVEPNPVSQNDFEIGTLDTLEQRESQSPKVFSNDFDIVVNTQPTGAAQTVTDPSLVANSLKILFDRNSYTSTIVVHVEVEAANLRELLTPPAPALVAEPGYLSSLGGVTFLSTMSGQNLMGKEVVGLFMQSPAAKRLQDEAKSLGLTESQLAIRALNIMVNDLEAMSESKVKGSRSLAALVGALKAANQSNIVSFKSWSEALPYFGKGHMSAAVQYRNDMGENGYFYMGQAVYGRSIAMVLPGVKQDFPRLKNKVRSFLDE